MAAVAAAAAAAARRRSVLPHAAADLWLAAAAVGGAAAVPCATAGCSLVTLEEAEAGGTVGSRLLLAVNQSPGLVSLWFSRKQGQEAFLQQQQEAGRS
jgi:outer membrane lipoprotein SlyB